MYSMEERSEIKDVDHNYGEKQHKTLAVSEDKVVRFIESAHCSLALVGSLNTH